MPQIPFFPQEASSVAFQVDLLLVVLLALSGFFTSIVVFLIIYFSVKYRRGKAADRKNPPEHSTKIELGWIFSLLVLGIGTFSWATILYFRMQRPPADTLDIYVVGKQWMWQIQHTEGQREINELHVPLDQPVRLIMTSEDVIHSFFVPAFRLKYDVIPGRYTSLWFTATRAGTYHIFCAEYCGTEHAGMIGQVVVMQPRDYEQWLGGNGSSAATSQSGEQLFSQLGCAACHPPGTGNRAPSLSGLFGSQVPLQDGTTVTADENYIRESILLPERKIVAGFDPIMPTYQGRITENEIIQLIEFIKSIGGAPTGSPGSQTGDQTALPPSIASTPSAPATSSGSTGP